MQLEQIRWTSLNGWISLNSTLHDKNAAQLVLLFTDPDYLNDTAALDDLVTRYPNANIIGGTSAGNILGTEVNDDDMVATAVYFEKSRIRVTTIEADSGHLKQQATQAALDLQENDLKHILVLSDGLTVNGSSLAEGLNVLKNVSITGGLTGDKGRFEKTYVISNGKVHENGVIFVGFYGDNLDVHYGCFAGWDEFGVDRVITKSVDNVVYEIDGQPALNLYRTYLGDLAEQLPASGLRFPLSIRAGKDLLLIRTLLAIDEEQQSLTFAGDVPEGAITLLMKGSTTDLIEGARNAAKQANGNNNPGLAVVISCVGRRLLMGQMVEEELEVVQEELGDNTMITGFYSYGELAPYSDQYFKCELHNQTMTLFSIYEK